MTNNVSSSSTKFKGVRRRSWGRWVSEIRLPHSRERVWLGSFSSAEEAACAFDAATLLLRGSSSSSSSSSSVNPLQPQKRRRSRRGLNLPHLQLAPFLKFSFPISRFKSSSSDPQAFKTFIRAVATSTVAAALFLSTPPPDPSRPASAAECPPEFVPVSDNIGLHSNHPSIALESCDFCCNSPVESFSGSDYSSPAIPLSADFCSRSIDSKEQMAMDAIFLDDDLTVLRELEGYLASEPFFPI